MSSSQFLSRLYCQNISSSTRWRVCSPASERKTIESIARYYGHLRVSNNNSNRYAPIEHYSTGPTVIEICLDDLQTNASQYQKHQAVETCDTQSRHDKLISHRNEETNKTPVDILNLQTHNLQSNITSLC